MGLKLLYFYYGDNKPCDGKLNDYGHDFFHNAMITDCMDTILSLNKFVYSFFYIFRSYNR